MAFVTGVIHSFLYFFAYLDAAPVVRGLMFVLFGIPIVGLHVLVWAVARFTGVVWALAAALLANACCALVGILWPTPVPGSGSHAGWTVNALVFVVIGMATMAVLIFHVRYVHRRFAAPGRA